MNAQEMKRRVEEILTGQFPKLPHDVAVPKYYRWEGPEPIPQEDYNVEYHGDAAEMLRRVGDQNQHLSPLHRRLRIEVDLNHHIAQFPRLLSNIGSGETFLISYGPTAGFSSFASRLFSLCTGFPAQYSPSPA